MIDLSDVSFGYESREMLFHKLNLRLDENDCVLLQGENGSGKSTLLKLIVGMLKPLSGKIMVAGKAVEGLAAEHFTHVHYHSQNTAANVLGMSPKDDWAIWRMSLPELPEQNWDHNQLFSTMSSGQQKQHSHLILPFLMSKFWILDEPFASLDEAASEALYRLLTKHKALGRGMLLVAHELQPSAEICNRILVLQNGRLVERV